MTLAELIAQARTALGTAITTRTQEQDALVALRSDENLTEEAVAAQVARRDAADTEVARRQAALDELEAEQTREAELAALQARTTPAANRAPAYDQVARVGQEERTYRPDQDRRGQHFERDVAAAFLGDYEARDRLARHMSEERVERGAQIEARAAGTGAFSGLVVPQYLTDLYAPAAAARRPFADACRSHDLPAQGMTVNISRITTATSTALQASENTAVSATDIDDTLLTIPVQTIAGQQTLSRQSIERGAGVEPIVLDDLFRRYATTLDNTLLNQATTGLAASATTITYTSGSPTVVAAYPQVIAGLAGVEAAMLDMASGENIVVMHSRRWYWLQNGLSSTWPLISQPGIAAQMGGTNLGATYGSGVRGVLPNGTPVIVDNNVVTNLGGATNQDEIYVADRNECHLWEDPSAPMYIRAEQPALASLGVLMVVYGYAAYTHSRYAQAQKITGTGLTAPTFTGV
ncbi:phage major capsid protein [Streptomyces sp. NBC_01518]|uniref:phage major capsid protein n=1 Tax=Streptomyces sp. NBC_01518 TaxID=2903891 RepID=UPI0038659297